MHWDEIVGRERGVQLRAAVLRALEDAYSENCRRFAPEDLGDNNMTFGVNVSQNLRFLIEREVVGIAGIDVEFPRGSFVLRIDERFSVHFYKAPPGVFDVRQLRFDESITQIELVKDNTDQLAFKFESHEEPVGIEAGHLVVVHFGDPIEGLRRADVGAPVRSPVDGLQWDWIECLSDPTEEIQGPWIETSPERAEDEEFDLRLRPIDEEDGMTGTDVSG